MFLDFIKISISCALAFSVAACASHGLPKIERDSNKTARLVVEGKPFVVLGGELLNSSGSTASDMQKHWDGLADLNLNTVLLAVAWEQIEKSEGVFDFSEIEKIISQARERKMKLVLLWFGSWKNGFSGYVPHWAMRDTKRFPRVKNKDGQNRPCLSPFSKSVLEADKKAFVKLMEFVAEADPSGEVVIMAQVENEIGLLDDSRDRSETAEKLFLEKVPEELIDRVKSATVSEEILGAWIKNGKRESGSWAEVFGQENMLADEMFMAWHYARFVDSLAAAGKAAHNIPMFVNAWVIFPENPKPGQYPSGGPNSRMLDVWQTAAKNIDFISPDIYVADYPAKLKQFHRNGNPIFVPEACALWLGDNMSAQAKAFYTIGEFGAIGFSPFAINHRTYAKSHPLSSAYKVLKNISGAISAAEAGKNMRGFMQTSQKSDTLDFGDIVAKVSYAFPYKGYGLIIRLSKEDFLIAASGVYVKFSAKSGNSIAYGLVREGGYENGEWRTSKYIGGDEGGLVNLKLPPVYLTSDASESDISVMRVHIFEVENTTASNSQIF